MKNLEDQIIKLIQAAGNILVMPSSPPDGDSLGSSIAMYLALRKLGKTSTVVCADPVPEALQFLPMVSSITNQFTPSPDFILTLNTQDAELASIQSQVEENKVNIILTAKKGRFSAENVSFSHGENRYDLIITVDTASPQQLGRFYEDNIKLFSEIPVINIDHHPSNERFGLINHVDVMSSSTTELVLGLLESLEEVYGQELIDEDIATLLLSGVITDTGSFQHSNTNPKSFANSAKLIKRGARQQEIIQHIYKTKQLSTLRLWGRVLTNIRIEKSHRFLWSVITHKDLHETGSKAEETGGIIDELMSNAPDVDIVLLLKEKDGELLSGSIRTITEGVDASEIAAFYGGGGHAKAAGFRVKDATFASVGQGIIDKIKDYQSKRLQLESATSVQPDFPHTSGKPQLQPSAKVELKKNDTPVANQPSEPEKTIPKNDKSTHSITPGTLYKFEE